MKKLVLYFDSEQTRLDFLEDISELIIWNDKQRDDDCQRHYEDTVTYAIPDHKGYNSIDPDSFGNRLSYGEACVAIDPRYPAYRFLGHELEKSKSSHQ